MKSEFSLLPLFSRNHAKLTIQIGTKSAFIQLKVDKNSIDTPSEEVQNRRIQAIVDSLAGFCHALGQPATVLMSSVELLRMDGIDANTRKEVLDVCFDAVVELRSLLAEMKNRREYLAQAYLKSTDLGGTIAAMPEWSERMPHKTGSFAPIPPPPQSLKCAKKPRSP